MADIEAVLDRMISRELKNASNHVTRATIKLRVLMNIMKCLDVSMQAIYDTKNLIPVHISCSKAIEMYWFQSIHNISSNTISSSSNSSSSSSSNGGSSSSSSNSNNVLLQSSDEWAIIEKFLAKDFARIQDLVKLVGILKKRIPNRDFWCIFAVDGLFPTDDNFKMYFDNLAFGLSDDDDNDNNNIEPFKKYHVEAIRQIYRNIDEADPEKIGNVLQKILFKPSQMLENLSSTSISGSPNRNVTISRSLSSSSSSSSGSSNSKNRHSMDSDEDNYENKRQKLNQTIEKKIEICYGKHVKDIHLLRYIARWKKLDLETCEKLVEKRRKRKQQTPTQPKNNMSSTTPTTTKTLTATTTTPTTTSQQQQPSEQQSGEQSTVEVVVVEERKLSKKIKLDSDTGKKIKTSSKEKIK